MLIFINPNNREYVSEYVDVLSKLPVNLIIYNPRIKILDLERVLVEMGFEDIKLNLNLKDLIELVLNKKVKIRKYEIVYNPELNSIFIIEKGGNILTRLFRKTETLFVENSSIFESNNKLVLYNSEKVISIYSLNGLKKASSILDLLKEFNCNKRVYIYADKIDSIRKFKDEIIRKCIEKGTKKDIIKILVNNDKIIVM
ncbi:MAG: hypothetical protein RXQ22_01360 [Sulfolobus sp.]